MKTYLLITLMLCISVYQWGFTLSTRNELALINTVYLQQSPDRFNSTALWQPELNINHDFNTDFNLGLNMRYLLKGDKTFSESSESSFLKGKAYRLWFKAEIPQTELRFGLQRLNFGSAQILRPLQWFDNLDPTDKLQQTEGVQALLLRHYFLNNANIWFWVIRGEGKQRGFMPVVTKEDTPEFGGRLQYPLSNGEIGLTINHRQKTEFFGLDTGAEDRIGFDARLDYGIGLWAESFVSKLAEPFGIAKYQAPVTIGADYTVSIGNGIYTLLETQLWSQADKSLSDIKKEYLTFAFSANYPYSILDTFLYYGIAKDNNDLSSHTLLWRRSYDHLSWDLGLFWDAGKQHKLYNSRGIKLLLSYIF